MTGRALGRILTQKMAACHDMHLVCSITIRPNLELKTRPKQLLGSLPLDITLPVTIYSGNGGLMPVCK